MILLPSKEIHLIGLGILANKKQRKFLSSFLLNSQIIRRFGMANRTVKEAPTIKGTNPQYLIEKIIRSRIYDCRYWKEDCFALTGK
jgi:hypothetical protein